MLLLEKRIGKLKLSGLALLLPSFWLLKANEKETAKPQRNAKYAETENLMTRISKFPAFKFLGEPGVFFAAWRLIFPD